MIILQKPLISEKVMQLTKDGFYAFVVDKKANKHQIKIAVEKEYKVEVVDLKTISLPGKWRRAGKNRKAVQTGDFKKALVKLKTGQTLPFMETVQKPATK